MNCLVTGAAGFIGSHLCERLIADGHRVLGVDDLSTGRLDNLENLHEMHPRFKFMKADISDLDELNETEWLFHLAARADIVPSIDDPATYHDINVTGTLDILELARACPKLKKFVYAASSSCYGIPKEYPTSETAPCSPMYPYALTKYMGEQYVLHWSKVYGIPAISLRLFNVYGPRARTNGAYGAVFGVFLSQLANGAPLTIVGDGKQSRDFTYVTDVVDAFVKAAESLTVGRAINIGTGKPQTVNRLVDLLGPTTFVNIPDRPGEPRKTDSSIADALYYLDWTPKVPFEEGVAKMKALISKFESAPLWTPKEIARATKRWFEVMS